MCIILAFVSVYLGIKSDDVSLVGGKNAINFVFLYFIGHCIRNKYFIPTLKLRTWIVIYLVFNILECAVYYLTFGHGLAGLISIYGWAYNSPLLIVNAILFFMIFCKIKIESSFVSSIARSVFPIYLIHSNINVQDVLWPIVKNLSNVTMLMSNLVITVIIMISCIIIDKLLAPCYCKIGSYLVNRMNSKFIL